MIIISQHQQHMFVDHVRLINDEFQFKAKLSRYREGRLQSIDVESSIIILQPDAEMACTFLLFCCRTSLKYFVGKSIFSQCPQQTYRKKAKNSKEKKIWLKTEDILLCSRQVAYDARQSDGSLCTSGTTATHYENSESICLFGELWVKKKNAKFAENFIFITSVYSFVEFVCDFFFCFFFTLHFLHLLTTIKQIKTKVANWMNV